MPLTPKHDLRGGRSVWSASRHPSPSFKRLKRSTRAEVVVVGSGITGSLVSERLTSLGLRPLILDRRTGPLQGSTAASTALLQFDLDMPLSQLGSQLGVRKAAEVWRCSRTAVHELRTRTHALSIRAQFESRPSLYLAGNLLDARGLAREARARNRAGLSSELLTRKELRHHFGIDRAAAILSYGNAEADPVALAAGFLNVAIRRGARLYAPHDVIELYATARGVDLFTRDGLSVHARRVIFACGYEFPKIVPSLGHELRSTWAIATRPQPDKLWPQHALIWEAAEPYLYARTLPNGAVVAGGEDEGDCDVEDAEKLMRKTGRLEAKLHRLFPKLDTRASFAWAARFGSTPRGMPTIGQIPDYPSCYAALGYGGNGITFSMLAAQLLTDALRRRRTAAHRLFEFK